MRNKIGKVFLIAVRSIKTSIDQTTCAAQEYKTVPVQSLSVLLSSAGCMAAVIGFIVAFIRFVTGGGYRLQISAIKDTGWDAAFTSGNVSMLYGGITGTVVTICIVAATVFMAITFLNKATQTKRILMITDLVLMVLFAGITTVYSAIISQQIDFTDKQLNALRGFFSVVNYETLLKILIGLLFLTIAFFAVLLIFSEVKWLLGHVCKSAIISFGAIPLLLLITENLLALVAMVVFFIVFTIILFMIGNILKEAASAESGGTSSKPSPKPKNNDKKVEATPKIKEINVASGYRLFLDDGSGFGAPMTTCIFVETAVNGHEYLCTYKDFKDGKVIIKKGGKPITRLY